jgi:hypothetical protein
MAVGAQLVAIPGRRTEYECASLPRDLYCPYRLPSRQAGLGTEPLRVPAAFSFGGGPACRFSNPLSGAPAAALERLPSTEYRVPSAVVPGTATAAILGIPAIPPAYQATSSRMPNHNSALRAMPHTKPREKLPRDVRLHASRGTLGSWIAMHIPT